MESVPFLFSLLAPTRRDLTETLARALVHDAGAFPPHANQSPDDELRTTIERVRYLVQDFVDHACFPEIMEMGKRIIDATVHNTDELESDYFWAWYASLCERQLEIWDMMLERFEIVEKTAAQIIIVGEEAAKTVNQWLVLLADHMYHNTEAKGARILVKRVASLHPVQQQQQRPKKQQQQQQQRRPEREADSFFLRAKRVAPPTRQTPRQ